MDGETMRDGEKRYQITIPFEIQEILRNGGLGGFSDMTSTWHSMPIVGVLAMQIQYLQGFLIPMLHIGARKALAEATSLAEKEILNRMVDATSNVELIDPADMGPQYMPSEEVEEEETEDDEDLA